ncbi:MAG TPA: DUF973 family protein [Thermoprotei archaeon]|nr:DUF973 family protein [Thermoprotei archaeon]
MNAYTSYTPTPEKREPLIRGLEKLKTASILQIVSTIIIFVPLILLYISVFALAGLGAPVGMTPPANPPHPGVPLMTLIGAGMTVISLLGVIIVGAVLGLVAIYLYLVPAFRELENFSSKDFGTASTMVRVGYVWGLILLLIGLVVLIIGAAVSSAAVIILGALGLVVGIILLIIGEIGVIVGMFNLNSVLRESMFLVAGILFIVSIFVGILGFIAWILVYIGADNQFKKLSSTPPTVT